MDVVDSVAKGLVESLSEKRLLSNTNEADTENGISLLTLKNDTLLSYINNLALVAAAQLENNEQVLENARRRAIEQRVVLEKGIKGLESKLSYQIDKAVRAYRKSEEAASKKQQADNEEELSSDDDEDLTAYRPNVQSLGTENSDDESGPHAGNGKYIAPKISATAFRGESRESRPSRRRDFAMEEYLQDAGEAPVAEPSIGSMIMDHGRGGERTSRDLRKDAEVREYEESNFTRLSQPSAKRSRREAAQRQRDATSKNLFGEDWGFLDRGSENGRQKKRQKRH